MVSTTEQSSIITVLTGFNNRTVRNHHISTFFQQQDSPPLPQIHIVSTAEQSSIITVLTCFNNRTVLSYIPRVSAKELSSIPSVSAKELSSIPSVSAKELSSIRTVSAKELSFIPTVLTGFNNRTALHCQGADGLISKTVREYSDSDWISRKK